VLHWNATGVYTEMFAWIGTGKAYVTVIYNFGLMIVLGTLLGLLTGKISALLRSENPERP
jgi:hypothetical protein